jgi:hypothetical protein
VVEATHPDLGVRYLYCEGETPLLFTENETNQERLFNSPNPTPYVKDGIDRFVVHGDESAVNPGQVGTKAAALYRVEVGAGQTELLRLRLSPIPPARAKGPRSPLGQAFGELLEARRKDADAFYAAITPPSVGKDAAAVMRQALAGMLWSKQYYSFDVDRWLEEHGAHPLTGDRRRAIRNRDWVHMVNDDIISMPDKWEYPWYAAWDLAFHTLALAMVDPDFAKQQLALMLDELYLHPNGQIPAYEWNFGDVNPPVHAWATLFMHHLEKQRTGTTDVTFLKDAFQKLLLNFTWWVNRKDLAGRNVFQGGFLGLDNIGVFDRSSPLPTGGYLEQADGTAWMAFYTQSMLSLALELSLHDPAYEDMALKFIEHFFWIAGSMDRIGVSADELWDEEEGFFYDVLRLPDGTAVRLKVNSLVGLLPLCATAVIPREFVDRFPRAMERVRHFLQRHPELVANLPAPTPGIEERRLLAILNESKLRRVLARMLDEERFLSPYGIRSLSRWHRDHPYMFHVHGDAYSVEYLPAESDNGMFGGNSNWRGPVWFPMNALIIRGLLQFYMYYGDGFTVECPTGSGKQMTLFEVARELADRLTRIFLRDEQGRRPVYGGAEPFQADPLWRDHILFYEYFHGDNGAGLGASHQTGWTGIVARMIQLFGSLDSAQLLKEEVFKAALNYRRKPSA